MIINGNVIRQIKRKGRTNIERKIILCGVALGLRRHSHTKRSTNYIKRCNIRYRCDKILNQDNDRRNNSLDEMVALNQELGFYD